MGPNMLLSSDLTDGVLNLFDAGARAAVYQFERYNISVRYESRTVHTGVTITTDVGLRQVFF